MGLLSGENRRKLLDEVRQRIRPEIFDAMIGLLDLREPQEGRLEITCRGRGALRFVEPKFSPAISEAAHALFGVRPAIEFHEDVEKNPQQQSALELSPRAPVNSPGVPLLEEYTFERFIEGPSNRIAKAAAMQVAQRPFEHTLFLYGKSGVGKTHLLQALCHLARKTHPNLVVAYQPCEAFLNEFIHAAKTDSFRAFRARYETVDILAIDDIQILVNKDSSQNEFFYLFNELQQRRKQMVFSSDVPPRDIATFKERLSSRLESGLVLSIEPPGIEEREAIVRAKAEARGRQLPDDVCHYIATTITNNVRELEGAVTKVVGLAFLQGVPIDIDVARAALRHRTEIRQGPLHAEDVIRMVAQLYKLDPRELRVKSRSDRVTLAKQMSMLLCYRELHYTFRQLAPEFGGSSPNSVTHHMKAIQKRLANDPALEREYHLLASRIRDMAKKSPPPG